MRTSDFIWDLFIIYDGIIKFIITPDGDYVFNSKSGMLTFIDLAHILPLTFYVVDFILNRIIFPKR